MPDATEVDTAPACPAALAQSRAASESLSAWTRYRAWMIDGAIVTAMVTAAVRGAIDWDTAASSVAAVLLAHAPPGATSLETALGPLLRALPRVWGRK